MSMSGVIHGGNVLVCLREVGRDMTSITFYRDKKRVKKGYRYMKHPFHEAVRVCADAFMRHGKDFCIKSWENG